MQNLNGVSEELILMIEYAKRIYIADRRGDILYVVVYNCGKSPKSKNCYNLYYCLGQ